MVNATFTVKIGTVKNATFTIKIGTVVQLTVSQLTKTGDHNQHNSDFVYESMFQRLRKTR